MFIYDGEAYLDIWPLLGPGALREQGASNEGNKFEKVNKDKILMVHLPDVFLKH